MEVQVQTTGEFAAILKALVLFLVHVDVMSHVETTSRNSSLIYGSSRRVHDKIKGECFITCV